MIINHDKRIVELNREAIAQYGKRQRLIKFAEELSELSNEVFKLSKLPASKMSELELGYIALTPLLEECADVLITMRCVFDTMEIQPTLVEDYILLKCDKFEDKLKNKDVWR